MFRVKLHFLMSFISLLVGFNHITSLYEFSTIEDYNKSESLSLLSYNVHHFYGPAGVSTKDFSTTIQDFVLNEAPNFLCVQDFYNVPSFNVAKILPYKYIESKHIESKNSLAIYSSYPIIAKKSLNFSDTGNNAIFADVNLGADTLRIFNVHFQSLRVNPSLKEIQESDKQKLASRLSSSFKKQIQQLELVEKHILESPYPVIISGDFNNTAFSYLYRSLLSHGLVDAFSEKGKGFGKTFDFDIIPIRIDFTLFPKEKVQVLEFITYDVEYSDHYPIMSYFTLK
jgi:endonuclease/exonuclease/phosphatase family metal-dependent hydrolase